VVLRDGERRSGVRVPVVRAGVITGRVLDAAGDVVERARVHAYLPDGRGAEAQHGWAATTNDLGDYRLFGLAPGRYVVCASGPELDLRHAGSDGVETCHPASPDVGTAAPIVLGRSEIAGGIDVTLLDRDLVPVSGRVVGADGQPVADVMLSVNRHDRGGSSGRSSGEWMKPDGTFLVRLAPGQYELEASVMRRGAVETGGRGRGLLPIVVGWEPLAGLEIVMGAGGRVSGRLLFEGEAALPGVAQVGVNLVPAEGSARGCRVERATVGADWTVALSDVYGPCRVEAWAGGPWALKMVRAGGRVLSDRMLSLEPGSSIRDLEVVFTSRRAGLWFEVSDERGTPTREFVVVVFPTAREAWRQPWTPAVHTYVPPDASAFALQSATRAAHPGQHDTRPELTVIGGEYYVAAIDDATWQETRDPAFLERLAERALRVTLADGENRVLVLRRLDLGREPL
jgi:hypothetical protein